MPSFFGFQAALNNTLRQPENPSNKKPFMLPSTKGFIIHQPPLHKRADNLHQQDFKHRH